MRAPGEGKEPTAELTRLTVPVAVLEIEVAYCV